MTQRQRGEMEEGPLGDPESRREREEAEAKVRRINREDLFMLDRELHFRRWFGKYAAPLIMMDIRTSNGGDLQHFMGRRSLVLDMIKELDQEIPGFYERVLLARKAVDNELRQRPQEE